MDTLHLFGALDGNRLDGRIGECGVWNVVYYSDDTYDGPRVKFFPGTAGGHAIQVNSRELTQDSIGYLGSFAGTGVFFDPYTLEESFPRLRFRRTEEPLDILWRGQTHVAWDPENPKKFIVAIGDGFYEYNLDHPEEPTHLGTHGVSIPHALKRSGNYLVYGVMDSNTMGPARKIGIFDLSLKQAHVLNLDETAWHLTVAKDCQGRDCAWVVSECYEQGPIKQSQNFNYDQLAIGYRTNWVWKIDLQTKKVQGIAIPPNKPSHLSSDVVVDRDTVLYNCCASATIGIAELSTGRVRYIDERVGFLQLLRHPGLIRSLGGNFVGAGSMMHLPGNTHHLINALLASRWPRNFSDGSYGLALNSDRTRLFSAHRGLNQLIVYDYTALRSEDPGPFVKLPIVNRISFKPLRKYFPQHLSMFSDPRIGQHHMTSLVEIEKW